MMMYSIIKNKIAEQGWPTHDTCTQKGHITWFYVMQLHQVFFANQFTALVHKVVFYLFFVNNYIVILIHYWK